MPIPALKIFAISHYCEKARWALPAAHPTYNKLQIPAGVANDLASWKDRRSLQWVRQIYQQYR